MTMLMNILRQRNLQAFKKIESLKTNGRNPKAILQEMINNKQITQEQLLQAKEYAKNLGIDIPDQDFKSIQAYSDDWGKKDHWF